MGQNSNSEFDANGNFIGFKRLNGTGTQASVVGVNGTGGQSPFEFQGPGKTNGLSVTQMNNLQLGDLLGLNNDTTSNSALGPGNTNSTGMTQNQYDRQLNLVEENMNNQKSQNNVSNWMIGINGVLGALKYGDERKRQKARDARINAAEDRGIARRNRFAMNSGGE